MPALIFNAKKIYFSVNVNILTIYPKYTSMLTAQEQIARPFKFLTDDGQHYSNFRHALKKEKLLVDELSSKNPDHKIGHNDEISVEKDSCKAETSVEHKHLKLNQMITPELLNHLLEVLMDHKLITSSEQQEFWQNLQTQLNEVERLFDLSAISLKSILNQIVHIDNNLLLAHLHQTLLVSYRGYFNNDWTCIEKSISLQMLENICQTSNMTPKFAAEIIELLSITYPYFGMQKEFITYFQLSESNPGICYKDFFTQLEKTLDNLQLSPFRQYYETFFHEQGIKLPIYRVQLLTEKAKDILAEIRAGQSSLQTQLVPTVTSTNSPLPSRLGRNTLFGLNDPYAELEVPMDVETTLTFPGTP